MRSCAKVCEFSLTIKTYRFIFAKIIVRAETQYATVSIGMWKMLEMEYIGGWFTRFCAAAVLVSIPISILFMITQKFYQEAMGGAVKG